MPTPFEAISAEVEQATDEELAWYLVGAAHDATFSRSHNTTRFCQSDRNWLEVLGTILGRLGKRSWIYKEGAGRSCWVIETTWPTEEIESRIEPTAYARGYFDAEGGIPRDGGARFYVQFVQKDLDDLTLVRDCLEGAGIACGSLHNPSARVDPNYWRFFVRAGSHAAFGSVVGSWHPRKRLLLSERGMTTCGRC